MANMQAFTETGGGDGRPWCQRKHRNHRSVATQAFRADSCAKAATRFLLGFFDPPHTCEGAIPPNEVVEESGQDMEGYERDHQLCTYAMQPAYPPA